MGGQPAATDWKATLPDDLKSEASLASIKGIDDLAKSYVHAQRLVGTNRLEAPSDKWDEAKWSSFYDNIGRPKTPDGYKDPEGLTLDPDLKIVPEKVKAAREQMHKLGLTVKQQQALEALHLTTLNETVVGFKGTQAAAKDETIKALEAEWKGELGANLEIAKKAAIALGGQELFDYLDKSGLGNNVPLIKALNKAGRMMSEDGAAKTGSTDALGLTDTTSAAMEISRLKADKEFQAILFDNRHPGKPAALARWQELHKRANPN